MQHQRDDVEPGQSLSEMVREQVLHALLRLSQETGETAGRQRAEAAPPTVPPASS